MRTQGGVEEQHDVVKDRSAVVLDTHAPPKAGRAGHVGSALHTFVGFALLAVQGRLRITDLLLAQTVEAGAPFLALKGPRLVDALTANPLL